MVDSYSPKPTVAGVTTIGTFTPDELVICPGTGRVRTIASGQGILLRGTVLGRVSTGAATSAVKASGANTGNATMSAVTIGQPDKVGVYTVRMLTATTFRVEDPDGYVLGDGATGTAFADDIGFTMTVGGTPMVAGDGFDVTVAAGSGKLVKSVAAATDGSQVPYVILAEDVDATSADVQAVCYFSGTYTANHLIYGAGHSYATVFDPFRGLGINLHNSIPY